MVTVKYKRYDFTNKELDSGKDQRGRELANMLGLKRKKNNRYDTAWGEKSELGLRLSIERVLFEGE